MVQGASAQISPGDLATSHAELEGLKNCTKCHDLGIGDNVPNKKCLECHDDIQSLINQKRGYHWSREVRNKDCSECHSDHHGRKFDMMRFDEDNFDHKLTSYELEGEHGVIECKECHQSSNISDRDIRKRKDTFLGLEQDCISCHEDYHEGELTNNEDCASCHNIEAFRPAVNFNHDDTDYPLRGEHVEVDCKECHPVTTRNGAEFQQFIDIPFNDCSSCHEDAHNNQLPGSCSRCHTVESFTAFRGQRSFNHNQTDFDLIGSHRSASCFDCHQRSPDPLSIFQDQDGIQENDCAACHEDEHKGTFGITCTDCHNQNSWQVANIESMKEFDHDVTDYPLEGRHLTVECKECHTSESFLEPIVFFTCYNCHEDYHEGDFIDGGVTQDCKECHSLTDGFDMTTFTLDRHQDSEFVLEGAHVATPCGACHVSEEKWEFRDVDSNCADCHEDIHAGQFADGGSTDCATCHNAETWFSSIFNHDNTQFPLDGKHDDAACSSCHKRENGTKNVNYSIEKFECIDCHL